MNSRAAAAAIEVTTFRMRRLLFVQGSLHCNECNSIALPARDERLEWPAHPVRHRQVARLLASTYLRKRIAVSRNCGSFVFRERGVGDGNG